MKRSTAIPSEVNAWRGWSETGKISLGQVHRAVQDQSRSCTSRSKVWLIDLFRVWSILTVDSKPISQLRMETHEPWVSSTTVAMD